MKYYLLAALLALNPLTANAAENPPNILNDQQIEGATRAMEDAARNLTDILGLILRSIPQFEAPVIMPNGDILIRRVHKNKPPKADQSSTEGSKI